MFLDLSPILEIFVNGHTAIVLDRLFFFFFKYSYQSIIPVHILGMR